jgi:hypothetical protein
MRMRVIKRDFYESEAISDLSHWARELLIAVWSYVDDNGVEKDTAVSIAAECFRYDLARDPVATLKLIESGIDELWEAGWIVRYRVREARYIEAAEWDFWQKPQKPSKPRYPKSNHPEAVIDTWTAPDFSDNGVALSPMDANSGSVSGSVSAQDYPRRHSGDTPEALRSEPSRRVPEGCPCGRPAPTNPETGLCYWCERANQAGAG